mmetsp:Transcript_13939/g.42157  ORF Transcript_13939/g.42157 Transcript_13939/m.42157 type:complete len:347 (-) Transcript_13939:179-1219(-)
MTPPPRRVCWLVAVFCTAAQGFVQQGATQLRSLRVASAAMEEAMPPPQTMSQCISQATSAVRAALADGAKLLEVEFPPLPAEQMEAADTSAYDIAKANTALAVSLARNLAADETTKSVAILYPDLAEADRAVEDYGTDAPAAGVSFHSLRKSFLEADGVGDALLALIGKGKSTIKPVEGADCYVCLTFSAQELPDLETLCELENFDTPLVLFNLKLDTQRGDLGLPAFPPKDLQWRFLSRVKPAYYLRTRQYSLSMPTPPFVVNYQGAIFRQYPGGFQSLLDTGSKYRCVTVDQERPALGTFKQTLTNALQLEGGKTEQFARTGVKAITWWEEDKDNNELHKDWRL